MNKLEFYLRIMNIMKKNKISEFHVRTMKIKKKNTFHAGHKNYKTFKISSEKNAIMKMLAFNKRIMKIMKIIEFH